MLFRLDSGMVKQSVWSDLGSSSVQVVVDL